MAKKVSKWFRIGVEGDTCDGRVISGDDIQEMADSFDPRVYGCRINLEHIKSLWPDSPFKRYGDVTEVKAEVISDDSALNGKKALFARIAPLDELVSMVRAGQKVYTSMEIRPNFSNSGKCYLIGLAVTDDPASLGTEYLEFCSRASQNPLAGKKDQPGDLFSVASLAELEFEDVPDTMLNSLTDKVKSIFSRKQVSDDARLADVHEAVTAVSEQVQTNLTATETRVTELETAFAQFKQDVTRQTEENAQAFTTLKSSLDNTESHRQPRREKSKGGTGDELLTNC
ncbi:GPO family capsid scaffolding protein [Escherichia coli]|uniref:GPO family capsid scaffolding protein n=1 Tax=Escherichia coli TaxID=562 RepID=UPI000BE525DF|nr:GPO family capsid scaffolding protein [Escherichia coli]EFL2968007.1 GPO family capsid scaffolding protein [Escherichia coli]EFM0323204.1 GPO family capsid scaffolding protein [Escherichia coli]EFN8279984.1 GPO family capsid scaffolding protein [Escherichia coli]EIX4185752.1 GPO family capsid scaffolding protein [Escherichia coli]EME5487256.1 GPO family capsid scaffolding protein [Escherichia coli]